MFKNNARKTLVLVKYCAIIAVLVFIRCFSSIVTLSTIRYNRTEEFSQKKIKKKKLKQIKRQYS